MSVRSLRFAMSMPVAEACETVSCNPAILDLSDRTFRVRHVRYFLVFGMLFYRSGALAHSPEC